MQPLYVLHPSETVFSGFGGLLKEVIQCVSDDPAWSDCRVVSRPHNVDGSYRVRDRVSEILGAIGPVVVVDPVQSNCFLTLRDGLAARTVVEKISASCAEDVWDALERAQSKFARREPFLPCKYLAAFAVLWKLDREGLWGGVHSYMWATDIPRGRGVPGELAAQVLEVVNDLYQADWLVQKSKKSRLGKGTNKKYGLNPDRQTDLLDIMRTFRQDDERLPRHFWRDANTESVRVVDDALRLWTEHDTAARR